MLDGTDIAALLSASGAPSFRVGDVILGLNIIIFLTAATPSSGPGPACIPILTYVAASQTLDFILHGLEEYTAIDHLRAEQAAIREAVSSASSAGVTIYKGRGGKSGEDRDILFCVVTRLEIGKVRSIVEEHDASAFVVVYPLADAKGRARTSRTEAELTSSRSAPGGDGGIVRGHSAADGDGPWRGEAQGGAGAVGTRRSAAPPAWAPVAARRAGPRPPPGRGDGGAPPGDRRPLRQARVAAVLLRGSDKPPAPGCFEPCTLSPAWPSATRAGRLHG